MKIWLVSQEETDGTYDTWDALVVAAESEEQAQRTLPNFGRYGWMYEWHDNRLCIVARDRSLGYAKARDGWATRLENVKVKFLGDAAPGTEVGIILASFNAG